MQRKWDIQYGILCTIVTRGTSWTKEHRREEVGRVTLSREDLDYFDRGELENPKFWSRLGGKPELGGTRVLDVGCGHGSLCIDIASSAAEKVVGLDLNETLIDFANENLRQNYPEFIDKVEFRCMDLKDYSGQNFDFIVSKSTFEHVMHLDEVLREMGRRLRIGGILYAGFGPLYNSPLGDHRFSGTRVPWAHLLFNEERLLRRVNRQRSEKISSLHDLGLNRMSLADYKRTFRESGLDIVFFRVNQSEHAIAKLFSLLRRIPPLEEYFSYNIYCLLQRKNDLSSNDNSSPA